MTHVVRAITSAVKEKAAFLDRDGVIVVDHGYVHRVEDLRFVPGAVPALQRLQAAHWRLVVVTNQSGIARGLYAQADYEAFTARMRHELAGAGVHLDAVHCCPHLPDASVPAYRLACNCRKPGPGMLQRAARELALNLPASVMIGDRASDVQAGRAAGVGRCLLVRSGLPLAEAAIGEADAVFDDLAGCADALLSTVPPGSGGS